MERKHADCSGDGKLEIDAVLHPSRAYGEPSEVVHDADLSLSEKRAILASWASDACAIEAAPELRKNPRGRVVSFDEIMDALKELDAQARAADLSAFDWQPAQRPSLRGETPGSGQEGSPLH